VKLLPQQVQFYHAVAGGNDWKSVEVIAFEIDTADVV
jgi:hypothetical protein